VLHNVNRFARDGRNYVFKPFPTHYRVCVDLGACSFRYYPRPLHLRLGFHQSLLAPHSFALCIARGGYSTEHSPNKHSLYPKDEFLRSVPPPVEVEAAFEETYMVISKQSHGVEVVANEEGTNYRDSIAAGASRIHNPRGFPM
jgi:hypothetical protein